MGREIKISIIAVSDIKIKETLKALEISSKSLNPTETLLFTSKSINLSNDNYNLIKQGKWFKSLKDSKFYKND